MKYFDDRYRRFDRAAHERKQLEEELRELMRQLRVPAKYADGMLAEAFRLARQWHRSEADCLRQIIERSRPIPGKRTRAMGPPQGERGAWRRPWERGVPGKRTRTQEASERIEAEKHWQQRQAGERFPGQSVVEEIMGPLFPPSESTIPPDDPRWATRGAQERVDETAGGEKGGEARPAPEAPRVRGDDPALAAAGTRQAAELASALGLPPRVEIEYTRGGAAAARGGGVATAAGIELDAGAASSMRGREVMAHELVHVAQMRLAGRSQRVAAEREARVLARSLAAGQSWARAAVPLAPQGSAGFGDDEGDGFRIEDNGATLVVERPWYEAHYAEGPRNAAATEQILAALAAGPMPWISQLSAQERAQAAAAIAVNAVFRADETEARVAIRKSIYLHIGLPPGTDVVWEFPLVPRALAGASSDRMAVVYLRSSVLMPDGSGREASATLLAEVFAALERQTALAMDVGLKNRLLAEGHFGVPAQRHAQGAAVYYDRLSLTQLFGAEAWREFEVRAAEGGGAAGGSTGATLDESLGEADKAFAERFLRELGGDARPEGTPLYVGPSLLAVWREIDAHPNKQRILEALRTSGGEPTQPMSTTQRFRNAMHAIELGEVHARLGIEAAGQARARPFSFPVEGAIVNHGDLLFTGKKAAFSFRTSSQDDAFAIPWVDVTWVVTEASGPNQSAPIVDRGHTSHRDYASEAPDRYEIAFERPGIYEINALVDHHFYLPNAFSIYVEVKTESERLTELESRVFDGGMFGQAQVTDASYEFADSSWTDSTARSTGTVVEGALPIECGPGMLPPQHLDRLRGQRERIQRYVDSGRADPRALQWAAEYLRSLDEAEQRIRQEQDAGAQLLHIQGAYLARASNATSQELSLVATAQRQGQAWRVSIHDTTQAFDNDNSRYSEVRPTFRDALEATFVELSKSYPSGQMSVRVETLDEAGISTGRFLGFTLDCNSTWEVVRSTVWDPSVQVVVNIAGAVVVIFAPYTAPVVVPALVAYNGIETVSQMVAYYERDTLTTERVWMGIGQLAIDILPYVGQATRTVKLGTRLYYVMEGLELAGDVVLLNQQAMEEIQTVRFGAVRQAAELAAQVEVLEHDNQSDPRLPGLRAELARVQEEAANAWASAYGNILAQQGLMRGSMRAMGHIGEIHAHRQAENRAAFKDAVSQRGARAMADADVDMVARALAVEVVRIDGGDVRIAYDVGALGGITNVRLEVGRSASLEWVAMHETTLRSMRRYEGLTGSLRNLLERVQAYKRGGGRIPPGSRAFEAHFELQKLPQMVAEFRERLSQHGLDDTTRESIELQIASLEAQIREHASHLDDLAPGLGFVAARADDDGTVHGAQAQMGSRPGEHPREAPAVDSPVPIAPERAASPRHQQLLAQRGHAAHRLDPVPSGWTAALEAEFRYGPDAYDIPEGYRWVLDDSGVPSVGRARRFDAHGAELPPRRFVDGRFEEAPAGSDARATRADAVAAYAERGGSGSDAGRLLDRAQQDVAILATRGIDAAELPTLLHQLASDPRVRDIDAVLAEINGITADTTDAAHQRADLLNELVEARHQLAALADNDTLILGEHRTGTGRREADLRTGSGQMTEVKSVRAPVRSSADLSSQISEGLKKFDSSPDGDYRVVVYGIFDAELRSAQGLPGGGDSRNRVDDAGNLRVERRDGEGGWREVGPRRDWFDRSLRDLRNMTHTYKPPGARRVFEVIIRMDGGISRTFRRDASNEWRVVNP